MKVLTILFLFLAYPFHDIGNTLPTNSSGKVSFQESVGVEGLNKELLFKNALNYVTRVKKVNSNNTKVSADFAEGVVSKSGSFLVYKKGLFTPQVHGEIKYVLTIDVSDEGFEYNFTDFVFHYYEKNRYGVFAPVNGKKKALEEEKFAGMQELWQEHKQTTLHHINNHIGALKASMSIAPSGAGVYDQQHYQEMN